MDSRNKLQQAIANKRGKPAAPPPGGSAPRPPAKPAPSPPQRSVASRAPSAGNAKAKKPAKSKKKQPKAKKASGGGSGFLSQGFQKFAKTVMDEFKSATSEISPKALINTAAEGLQGLKAMVTSGRSYEEDDEAETSPSASHSNGASGGGAPGASRSGPGASDAKAVHRKSGTGAGQHAAGATAQPVEQANVEFSAAKVQRHSGGKKKTTEEDELSKLESEIESAEEPCEGAEARAAEPQPQENTETRPNESPEESKPVAQAPEKGAGNGAKPQQKRPVRNQPKSPVKISKTEHAIRGLQALQAVLSNPIWAPIIIKSDAKPSSLYAPRERFDEFFADPVFREGLKAASRLATTYTFPPEKMRFIAKTIETVRSFNLDSDGNIKSHTELLTKALPEETVKSAFLLFGDPHVQHLLFSVGTRLGMFLPTIEILTRIYVGLRKKANLIPGDRLKIQHEVLIRYQKTPYTEDMAKKARNLALTYFSDYQVEHAMNLYKERFDKAPEGHTDVDSYYRRHEAIKTNRCNLLDELGVRIGLSVPMLASIKNRFVKAADVYIDEIFARAPSE